MIEKCKREDETTCGRGRHYYSDPTLKTNPVCKLPPVCWTCGEPIWNPVQGQEWHHVNDSIVEAQFGTVADGTEPKPDQERCKWTAGGVTEKALRGRTRTPPEVGAPPSPLPELVIWDDAQLLRELADGLPTNRPILIMARRWDIPETLNRYLASLPLNVLAACVVLSPPKKYRIVEVEDD